MGLKLYNMDYDSRLMTCHKPYFHKKRGENRYCIYAVLDGYEPKKDDFDEGTMNCGIPGIWTWHYMIAFVITTQQKNERTG